MTEWQILFRVEAPLGMPLLLGGSPAHAVPGDPVLMLDVSGPAVDEARLLLDRVRPTVPLIAANMDVTGTMAMARALGQRGALTALHKHYPEDELAKFFAGEDGVHAFYSLGAAEAAAHTLQTPAP